MVDCDVRVHKINRTTAALIGNIVQKVDIGGSYSALIEAYHSPMGNSQFNRYPMKIGPISMCEFLNDYWGDYYGYVVQFIENIAKPGECPFTARSYQVKDWIMDSRLLPPYVSTGLWRMMWSAWDNQTGDVFTTEIVFKVYDDGHF
ncbi:conserved hypothetical protein [Culex quinquefasciatus]|uniref:Uncharacterized protein n=1 Tax=Culex quinquefasciatus TaxID=7176 RepID=B0WK48_CULQU|nr:conserved hypothetical protein [Culex quinquefasciatus]|eukprot:XP_001849082.1 conserved hypothetical protein [Culex quinquefasciatus]